MDGPFAAAGDAPPEDPSSWDASTAVAVLYAGHWQALVRLAALLSGDASVAEEVAQEAFVGLYRRWDSLVDPAAALGYLRTSVVNGVRSAVRHRVVTERHRPLAMPAPAGPEEAALRAAEDREVLRALRSLPRRQQEVLVLRYYADLSEADIAATLRVSRGSVKRHASRGMATLRERFGNEKAEGVR